jgi:hypothetical protein
MKTLFQILSAVLLGFSPIVANAALQNGKIQTDVTVGEVYTLDAKAKPVRVIPGHYYDQGSTFSTKEDSTIQLVFSNGATLLLSPNTTVVVRTFKQVPINLPAPGKYLEVDREPSPSVTEIILEKGKVVGEVRKLNSQSSYTIRTGVGIVKIKGTIFTVAYAEDVAKGAGNIDTSCVRGSVDLTLFGSNSGAVPVEAGKRITAQGPIVDENGKTRDIPEIIPVTLSVSKLDAKQVGDIATVLSTGSSLPVAVINAVKETAVTAPPPGSPETTTSTPISPNELPETPKKSVTETPTINQVINTVVNNTQTVIEREQQTNPSPVQ